MLFLPKLIRFLLIFQSVMKKSNFYKEGGIQCVVVLKEIFGLVFSGKNLFRTLKMNPDDISFKKNTTYRFLNSSSFNWARFLLLLVTRIIGVINRLISEDRATVLITDDSLYNRSRSKKVELLSKVFDHTSHRFIKGFKMLTLKPLQSHPRPTRSCKNKSYPPYKERYPQVEGTNVFVGTPLRDSKVVSRGTLPAMQG